MHRLTQYYLFYLQGVLIRGEDNVQPGNNPAPANNIDLQDGGLHAAHQAILQQAGPIGFQPYKRPTWFAFRVGDGVRFVSSNSNLCKSCITSLPIKVACAQRFHVVLTYSARCHTCTIQSSYCLVTAFFL